MKSKAAGLPLSYRLAVTSRSLAAVFGGYLLAAMASVCITLLLPVPRAEAVISGMMLSFLFYLVAFLWCFACRSAWQAWLGVLVPSLVLAMISGLAYWMKSA
ncbi:MULTISPECIES: DUF3649 domain-containing protein [Pseudomonas]|uniref:DUF3649 domain-containing protein n=1 Tax=Pseudomonas TaxID=286 RepID=UPI000C2A9AAB|nr:MULTISPECIES: DUF3649 domain-containing protein [Pseudomonas]MCE6982103.1 DUF3649 domain-containing protein [Pseudomonas frederiksbergensis]MBF4206973.1 DUF3649 domain-containing protein [Pseudomonas donghuensis]MBS7597771.1 DUF3649 domain-containing protein [Pseudomonas sp. RC2C2]MCP3752342.1 DUF3649 domain-containing protein [Pseudomonas sp. SBB6]MCP6699917.1 DUF3649 domain-containing protein [Pseudomonas donghuensis]